ncbi:MAG: class I mannose-6-phosphate isomerase [Prevotella sp.]|nr:class I mannose-6-phosphate isomerase [Prevotella sp.]
MKPLKFNAILKETIWGGSKLIPFKHITNNQQPSSNTQIGESWEISGVPGHETTVAEGEYKGLSLNQLVALLGEQLVGKKNLERFSTEFPLLIKFINASQDLSIQVHPNDEVAQRQGYERGKSEMWYLMKSDAEAKLYCGLKNQITPEEYKQMVDNDTICDALARYEVSEGDVFFLPAGRIHTIGTGCFLVEIQQTSDVTWRIYDYKRRDKDGNYRPLHTQQAAESIDFNVLDDYQTHYQPQKNQRVELVACPHFITALYDLDQPMTLDYSQLDSFVVLIGVEGHAKFTDNEGNTFTLEAGETVLIPAVTQNLQVEGTLRFLETYV